MTDYTQYDYQALVDRMTNILRDKDGWGDAYQSSTGQTLIQLIADTTDHLHYMLERRTQESYLDHAKLRTSVIARASELGYRHKTATPNFGVVRVTVSSDDIKGNTTEIVIPSMTKMTVDGTALYTADTAIIPVGSDSVEVSVLMGAERKLTLDNVGDGAIIQNYENIVTTTLSIKDSNGVEYQDVFYNEDPNKRALSYLGADEAYFDIRYTANGMKIIFGDGGAGKKPAYPISVSFLDAFETDPILKTGIEAQLAERLIDVDGSIRDVDIVNISQIKGYVPPESTESIRGNAPDYHKTNLRAVTNSDYGYWTRSSDVLSIVDAKAYGEEETGGLIFSANNVFITYLKSGGEKLTVAEEIKLREHLDKVKTSQAHIVLSPADVLNVIVNLKIKKNKRNPSANDEVYAIIRKYLVDVIAAEEKIGGSVYASDIIHGLYALESTRNENKYRIIEYASLDVKAEYPFTYPQKTSTAFVSLDRNNFTAGDKWILHIDGVPCIVTVLDSDTNTSLYNRMRAEIIRTTNLRARVVVRSLVLENYGIPSPIDLEDTIGSHRLVGVRSMYNRTDMIDTGFVGTTIVDVKQKADAVQVKHFYYSSEKGNRPAIPLRIDTRLTFTAPCDSAVRVWSYRDFNKPEERTLLRELNPEELFEYRALFDHVIQFEYLEDTTSDAVADIDYGSYMSQATHGILIDTYDGVGTFLVEATSGDLHEDSMVECNYKVPAPAQEKSSSSGRKPAIYKGSLEIVEPDGEVIFVDDGAGKFKNIVGDDVGGGIDYMTGNIRLPFPIPMRNGNFYFRFYQDDMESLSVDDVAALKFIEPKRSYFDTEETASTVRIE